MFQVINLSTSSQVCVAISKEKYDSIREKLPKSVTVAPYFYDKILLVSASLNGGNVLEKLIETILTMFKELELNSEANIELVWKRVIRLSEKYLNESKTLSISNLCIEPMLFGERHDMQTFASIKNIRLDNLSLGALFTSTCHGLIRNLREIFPISLIKSEFGCKRVLGTGSALLRNSLLKHYLELEFNQLEIEYRESCDAAIGAAMFLNDFYINNKLN